MGDPSQFEFSFQEVAEALIKQQKIHEGVWSVTARFGIKALNVGSSDEDLLPTAIIPLVKLGLRKVPAEDNLSVDAAKVNPVPRKRPPLVPPSKPPRPRRNR